MTIYYETQERAMAPGIADGWPDVIPAPHTKNGRLVKLDGDIIKERDEARELCRQREIEFGELSEQLAESEAEKEKYRKAWLDSDHKVEMIKLDLEAMKKERDDWEEMCGDNAGRANDAEDRIKKLEARIAGADECNRLALALAAKNRDGKREAESERDQLAAAVEKMRESLDIPFVTGDAKIARWEWERMCQVLKSIPTNYASILEARDKRVRAENRDSVLVEIRDIVLNMMRDVDSSPVKKVLNIVREYLEAARAEKGEKG